MLHQQARRAETTKCIRETECRGSRLALSHGRRLA